MRTHLALGIVLAACGSKDDPTADINRSADVTPSSTAAAARDLPPPKPRRPPPPKELGTCNLTVSGAFDKAQTTEGGTSATNVSYWFDEAERKNMMGVDGFVVNCNGPDIRFSIVPGGGALDGMPFKPKTYRIDKGKPVDGANVMIGFGKATMASPTGTVEITAFDKRHIAGTVELAGKLQPGKGDLKLTGSFDLVCPGFSACEF